MAARGKKSSKKEKEDLDCSIIDAEQFENEKEFRRIARPRRSIKSEEDKPPVVTESNSNKQVARRQQQQQLSMPELPLKRFRDASFQEPSRMNRSQSIPRKFTDAMWSRLSATARNRCQLRLETFRKELAGEEGPRLTQPQKDAVERIFACLSQAVEELVQDTSQNFNEAEQKVRNFQQHDQYEFIRVLSLKIESLMKESYPKNDPNHPDGYPSRFNTLFRNFRDDQNKELRRKILSGNMTCHQLVKARQEELWSTQKRQEKQHEDKKFYDSRKMNLPTYTEPQEQNHIDYVLPEIRFEKKRVESCEESIESRISFIKEKLTKQMAEIEIDWLDCFKKDLKDLSPKLAEQLSQDFARTMSRQPSISKMQMEEPPCP